MIENKISITRIVNDDVKKAVFEALELIKARELFRKSNLKVLIKPNLMFPKKPERAVTTHPAVIRALIQWIKQFNPKEIIVADSSGTHIRGITDQSFKISGVKSICEDESVMWIPFEKTLCKIYHVKNPLVLKEFPASVLLEKVDLIINVPKIKTHRQCLLTCSIKNMFGTVILGNKSRIHAKFPNNEYFNSALADIYSISCPQLTLIDGYYCQEGNGPTAGDVIKMDLIISGFDPVALDTLVCKIIGFNPKDVIHIAKTESKGLGNSDLKKYELLGESIDSIQRSFKKPKNQLFFISLLTFLIEYATRTVFTTSIVFDPSRCRLCSICWQNCPVQVIKPPKILKIGLVPEWNKIKCIKCYCCAEFCPNEAIDFKVDYKEIFLNYKEIFLKYWFLAISLGVIVGTIFIILINYINL